MINKKVGIILVNYNGAKDTIECLNSLHTVNYLNKLIYVVDNNSNKDDVDYLEKKKINFPEVRIIKLKENIGFSGGNNVGIKEAMADGCEVIGLLNNDTIVETDFLNQLVVKLFSDERIGAVVPQIRDYFNKSIVTYGGGEINYLKGSVFIEGINRYEDSINNAERCVTFGHGCCLFMKSKVISKVGLLPEEYFLYFEDADYSIQLTNSGYKILYCPESIIYHKESVSTKKGSDNFQYYFTRNRFYFIKKNFKLLSKLTAYPISVLYLIKKMLLKEFELKNIKVGLIDYSRGKTGKRDK
ncbi:glycosyltransferase family 2 protein [Streptococcus thermophilus]|uniref:glycosyltransferase family 2 protein n=1 Tax=Streptococcus thermophilus TaxID=1308 RepID=UPI0015C2321C|nr:glycosyltransferase family 2 protein [Streptococcus thermophilus]CAD0180095.1 Glycosyltransferase RfbF [Streptococcus thermophilus]